MRRRGCNSPMMDRACAVCLEEGAAAFRVDDCGHRFCRACLADWLRRSDLCPLCKVFVLSVEGRSRWEAFPAAELSPPEDHGPTAEHFAEELRGLLAHLERLEQKLEFYRHQAFYCALRNRIFRCAREGHRLLRRVGAGEWVEVEELGVAVEEAHLLACRLESGLGPAGPAELAGLVEEEEPPY